MQLTTNDFCIRPAEEGIKRRLLLFLLGQIFYEIVPSAVGKESFLFKTYMQ